LLLLLQLLFRSYLIYTCSNCKITFFQWSPAEVLKTASLKGYHAMNPCPVYKSNSLFLFFICIYDLIIDGDQIHTGENACVTSSAQTTRRVGMKQQTYRMCALVFYSGGDGMTWKKGKLMKAESNECQMAELIDQEGKSQLYCSGTEVKESGSDWLIPRLSSPAFDHAKNESSSPTFHRKTHRLHSHPSDKKSRKNLAVFGTRLLWMPLVGAKPLIIHNSFSWYSDLTHCEDRNNFACLMECRQKSKLHEMVLNRTHCSTLNHCLY
uniref:Uncharacterized protein n=1 Tax=Pygocentrus nattereri TaxID=42514 RepID=A0AAR2LKW6_PYGNA